MMISINKSISLLMHSSQIRLPLEREVIAEGSGQRVPEK